MKRSVIGALTIVVPLLSCVSELPTSDELSAAECLRDALAESPHLSDVHVVISAHIPVVAFQMTLYDGTREYGVLEIEKDLPGNPHISFVNPDTHGGFPDSWGIRELLARRCPRIPDATPEV